MTRPCAARPRGRPSEQHSSLSLQCAQPRQAAAARARCTVVAPPRAGSGGANAAAAPRASGRSARAGRERAHASQRQGSTKRSGRQEPTEHGERSRGALRASWRHARPEYMPARRRARAGRSSGGASLTILHLGAGRSATSPPALEVVGVAQRGHAAPRGSEAALRAWCGGAPRSSPLPSARRKS